MKNLNLKVNSPAKNQEKSLDLFSKIFDSSTVRQFDSSTVRQFDKIRKALKQLIMVVLFFAFGINKVNAQNNCNSAEIITLNSDSTFFNTQASNNVEYWYKFNPDSIAIGITFEKLGINKLKLNFNLYKGTCDSLILIGSKQINAGDSLGVYYHYEYEINNSYFIKITTDEDSTQFFKLGIEQLIQLPLFGGLPTGCDETCRIAGIDFEGFNQGMTILAPNTPGSISGFHVGPAINVWGWNRIPIQNGMMIANHLPEQVDFEITTVVSPLRNYCLSFRFANMFLVSTNNGQAWPIIRAVIRYFDANNNLVGTQFGQQYFVPPSQSPQFWHLYTLNLSVPPGAATARIRSVAGNYNNNNADSFGADIAYDDIQLFVNELHIDLTPAQTSFEVCPGTSVTLTTNPMPQGLVCDEDDYQILWSPSPYNFFNIFAIGSSTTVTPNQTTIYEANVFPQFNINCNHNQCNIFNNPIIYTVNVVSPNPNAGPDITVCANQTIQLGSPPEPNTVYTWSPTNFLSCTNCPITDFNAPNSAAGNTYTYILTAFNTMLNCSNTDTITVTVLPSEPLGIFPSLQVCDNQTFLLGGGTTQIPGTSYLYSYNGNGILTSLETSINLNAAAYGVGNHTFEITATTPSGCLSNANQQVSIIASPTVNAGEDFSVCVPNDFSLLGTVSFVNGFGNVTWTHNGINIGNSITINNLNSINYSLGPNTFSFSAQDQNGCISNSDDVVVNIIDELPSYTLDVSGITNTCGQITICLPNNAPSGITIENVFATPANNNLNNIEGTVVGNCVIFNLPEPHFGYYINDFDYHIGGGCINKVANQPYIRPCCSNITQINNYNDLINSFGNTINNQNIMVNGNLLIPPSNTLEFNNTNLLFTSNVGINLSPAANLNISNSYLAGCEVWNGIYCEGKSHLSFLNSELNDALYGIEIDGQLSEYYTFTTIHNSIFKRNLNSLFIHDILSINNNQWNMQSGEMYDVSIIGNSIFGNEPLLNGIPNSDNGVILRNVNRDLFIGSINSSSDINIIDGNNIGIAIRNSHLTLMNTNIVNSLNFGIRAVNQIAPINQTPSNAFKITIGDNSFITGNTFGNSFFNNTNNDIFISGHFYTSVSNNSFNKTTTGIRIQNCIQWPIEVTENRFTDISNGVQLINNNNPDVAFGAERIVENNIFNNSLYDGTNNSIAIFLSGVNNSHTSNYRIFNNNIDNFNWGIRSNTILNPRINFNEIKINGMLHPSTNVNYGILIQNNQKATITNNNIGAYKHETALNNAARYIGISNNQSESSNICSNNVSFMDDINNQFFIGTAIEFQGFNAPLIEFANNRMNNFLRGILLANNPTPLGIVGSNTEPKGNEWHEMLPLAGNCHTLTDFFVNNLTNELWCNDQVPHYPSPYNWGGPNPFLQTTNSLDFPECNPNQRPANSENEYYHIQTAQTNAEIIGNSANRQWIAKEMLGNAINVDNQLLQNATINNFNDSIQEINLGLIASALQNISYPIDTATIMSLSNIVSQLQPNISVENLYKELLLIIVQNPEGVYENYTQSALNRLKEIAEYCPFTKGNAVYMARTLLAMAEQTTQTYVNLCEINHTGNSNRNGNIEEEDEPNENIAALKTKQEFNTAKLFDVFPVPAQDNININCNSKEQFSYKIYNTSGKLVYEKNNVVGNTSINIKDLSNGIYQLHGLNLSTGKLELKRLVISN